MSKVFISYSHKDKTWVKDWLLPRIKKAGLKTHVDFRDFKIGQPSHYNMERAVETCEKTILIWTPDWIKSEFANFERLMLLVDDPLNTRKKMLPLLLCPCDLPKSLKIFTYADFTDINERDSQFDRLIRQIKKDFKAFQPKQKKLPALQEKNIDISRLPQTGYDLFGRQKELQLLNKSWEKGTSNILCFVAYGGTGKSTLINKWLEKMRWDNFRGAQKVYGWSFYSQRMNEQVTSANHFVNHALTWFGEKNPEQGSAWDKGRRLAELIRKQRTLLIIDGMESLQYTTDFERGKIRDNALSVLITELAKQNNGLCIVTTRENVDELQRFPTTTKIINLEQIDNEAGRAMLRLRNIQGSDHELEKATAAFGNHALAINLLAEYLHLFPGHNIQKAYEIPDFGLPERDTKHARRIILTFSEHFGNGPETEILHIMGLFDRPAEKAAIAAISAGEVIDGLTNHLNSLSDSELMNHVRNLRNVKLLCRESRHCPDIIDCHPIIHEHFCEKLRMGNPSVWKEANSRLYDYYKNKPTKQVLNSMKEMEPWFAAITHGFRAERMREAMDEVYWPRIKKRMSSAVDEIRQEGMKKENDTTQKLNAFIADLAVLSNFFTKPWTNLASGLSEGYTTWVLNEASFVLRALGHLNETVELKRTLQEKNITKGNWEEAAINAGYLCELYLILGDIKQAIAFGRQGVEFADKSESGFQQESKRATLADALHKNGNIQESFMLFKAAQEMQKKRQPMYQYLHSLWGYQFCDLLLSLKKYQKVLEQAQQTIMYSKEGWYSLLDCALDKLSIGRASMLLASQQNNDFSDAEPYFHAAIKELREAGTLDYIPLGLISRAVLFRLQCRFSDALVDLDEVLDIAERGEMRLYLTDYQIESSRLALAQKDKLKAHEHWIAAKKLVKETGYHRRDKEIKEIEELMR